MECGEKRVANKIAAINGNQITRNILKSTCNNQNFESDSINETRGLLSFRKMNLKTRASMNQKEQRKPRKRHAHPRKLIFNANRHAPVDSK
jgi:hypothetical protein